MVRTPVVVLFDGRCSVCAGSARGLVRLDRGRGRVELMDFRRDMAAADRAGISAAALEGSMHAIDAGGAVFAGPEAVRVALRAVGLGGVSWALGLPVIGPVFGRFYDWFARNRLRWFARADGACEHGSCRIDR